MRPEDSTKQETIVYQKMDLLYTSARHGISLTPHRQKSGYGAPQSLARSPTQA
jgi:hypothetical protein